MLTPLGRLLFTDALLSRPKPPRAAGDRARRFHGVLAIPPASAHRNRRERRMWAMAYISLGARPGAAATQSGVKLRTARSMLAHVVRAKSSLTPRTL